MLFVTINGLSQSKTNKLSANWGYEGLNNKQMMHEYNGFFMDISYEKTILKYIILPVGISMSKGVREDEIGRTLTRYDNFYFYSGIGSDIKVLSKHHFSLTIIGSAGLIFIDYIVPNENSFTVNGAELTYDAGIYYGLGASIAYTYKLTETLGFNLSYQQQYFTSNLGNNNFYNSHGFLADKLQISRIGIGFSVDF